MKTVLLSTGETVVFKDHLSHKADLTISEVWDQNRDATGNVPTSAFKRSLDAGLPLVIDHAEKDGARFTVTQEWLGDLAMEDYDLLASALGNILTETKDRIEAGKKNN